MHQQLQAACTSSVRGAARRHQLLDAAILTGESRPVAHAVGDEVAAGTRLLAADGNGRGDGGMVLVRAVRVGAKSTLGSMLELVERVCSIACFTSTKVRMLTQKALLGLC